MWTYMDLYGTHFRSVTGAPFEPDHTACSQSCSSSITTFDSSKYRYPTTLLDHLLFCDNQGLLKCLCFAMDRSWESKPLPGFKIQFGGTNRRYLTWSLTAVSRFSYNHVKGHHKIKNCLGDLPWKAQVNCHTPSAT